MSEDHDQKQQKRRFSAMELCKWITKLVSSGIKSGLKSDSLGFMVNFNKTGKIVRNTTMTIFNDIKLIKSTLLEHWSLFKLNDCHDDWDDTMNPLMVTSLPIEEKVMEN